jgi:hypothetical protein
MRHARNLKSKAWLAGQASGLTFGGVYNAEALRELE